ncbi:CHAT domain-containing protein [Lasiosphaeria miniovina]|uniref:CHAT domain-containing protein n=1 Tax=Lasiosphaeria miniovina TaxID=1954250 RepID=A0AA39ZU77_9PEZI|nr:CHAT domain-containing protein [Lasiosphaeria miniovina]KAK0703658.1 CHAT domain-containing protein [Lasiosphaeria miniovina]
MTGRLPDLYEAIRLGLEALENSAGNCLGDHENKLWLLGNLTLWFEDKYLREGSEADLEQAIKLRREAEETWSMLQSENWASRLCDINGGYYNMHLGTTREWAPLQTSSHGVIQVTLQDSRDYSTRLHNLGAACFTRFKRTGLVEDLSAALSLCRTSVDDTPREHLMRPDRLLSLGECYDALYSEMEPGGGNGSVPTQDENPLHKAIELFQDVIDTAAPNKPTYVSALHRLGVLYDDRFQLTGDLADLKMSLHLCQESVDITPKTHPDRGARLRNLGLARKKCYQIFHKTDDLEVALQLLREAADIPSQHAAPRADLLKELGAVCHAKYDVTRKAADLDAALGFYQDAYETFPDSGPFVTEILGYLGRVYLDKYKMTEIEWDFERAARALQKALDGTPQDLPNRMRRLVDLARCYLAGHVKTGTAAYLETAIQYSREATTRAMPAEHPGHLVALRSLGDCYAAIYKATGRDSDLEAAITSYNEALNSSSPGATPGDFLAVARDLLLALIQGKKWEQAWLVANSAISLIRSYTPRFLENLESQTLLSRISGLASDAAAVALSFGRQPLDAIQFLEEGRGISAQLLNELRTDVSLFARYEPELAKTFLGLRDQLEAPQVASHIPRLPLSRDGEENRTSLRGITRHITASSGIDKFISEFHLSNQRLSLFRSVPDEADLDHAGREGPIVMINVSYRCDAFLIRRGDDLIRALPLPRLSREDIEEKAVQGNLGSPQVLEWLWDTVTGPILDALGFTKPPRSDGDDDWSRVRWIPTGALSRFPLHAAGRHDKGSSEAVIDRVMSSYSPSIGAIIRGLQFRRKEPTVTKALLVAMEYTPGSARLPFATKELAMLRRLFQDSMSVQLIELTQQRTQEVLSSLQDCDIFHFAGHGYTDPNNPLQSHLRLEDWKANPLRVADLLAINLSERPPFLAYLSACGTGKIDDGKLLDQNIHLISACQLAGFRNVIGTLWEVNDGICVDVARIMYQGLRDEGITDRSVCRALHRASRELRDRWLRGVGGAPASSGGKVMDDNGLSIAVSEKLVITVNGRETAESDADRGDGEGEGEGASNSGVRLPRTVFSCDEDDEMGLAHWVPYVHFGA